MVATVHIADECVILKVIAARPTAAVIFSFHEETGKSRFPPFDGKTAQSNFGITHFLKVDTTSVSVSGQSRICSPYGTTKQLSIEASFALLISAFDSRKTRDPHYIRLGRRPND